MCNNPYCNAAAFFESLGLATLLSLVESLAASGVLCWEYGTNTVDHLLIDHQKKKTPLAVSNKSICRKCLSREQCFHDILAAKERAEQNNNDERW